jgi:tetratricopeptide (TPR) repeat protein
LLFIYRKLDRFMDIQEINQTRDDIYQHIAASQLCDAIDSLSKLIEAASNWDLTEEFNQLEMSYKFMLQYLTKGILDNQRDSVLKHIVSELYVLTDKCLIQLSAAQSFELFYARYRSKPTNTLDELILSYKETVKKFDLLNDVAENERNYDAIKGNLADRERTESGIFNRIWSTYPTTAQDVETIQATIADEHIPSYLKGLIMSALLLGLTKFYDEGKLTILLETYATSKDAEVQLRALTCAVITLYIHYYRVKLSNAIKTRIDTLMECPDFKKDISSIFIRLISTRNTENISKRVQEDLIPNLMKMSPDILKKVKDKNAPIDISDLEANPEWQDILDKSGISKKLEELNEIQLEGGDVFISTFSHLKTFPFFQTLSNWFLPYHNDHTVVYNSFSPKDNVLKDVIENAPFLCNSDKFSFCLSIEAVPESQKHMLMSQFDEQNASAMELKSTEVQSRERERDCIINKFIQDLYRFFKLFSRRREFFAVFDSDLNLLDLPYLSEFIKDPETLAFIAEFYLKNGFYADAIKYYKSLIEKQETTEPHIYQKIGFAYQNNGEYAEAIKYYQRYELANDNDAWNMRHIASCYRALKQSDKAVEYYKRAEVLKPDNMNICLNIGHCLLENGKVEDALQYYFKAEYLEEGSHKAWRPIAWCSFLTGNEEQSEKYYDKIVNEDKPSSLDYLNYGHLSLSKGDIANAIKQYRQSLKLERNDFKVFSIAFRNDSKYLIEKGLKKDDLLLILDAVKLASKQE